MDAIGRLAGASGDLPASAMTQQSLYDIDCKGTGPIELLPGHLTECFATRRFIYWLNIYFSTLKTSPPPPPFEMTRQKAGTRLAPLSLSLSLSLSFSLTSFICSLYFLCRAFKDFQGCQESQERGVQGWVPPNQRHNTFFPFTFPLFFHRRFSFPLRNLSRAYFIDLEDAFKSRPIRANTAITPLAGHWWGSLWSSTVWHLWITEPDMGLLWPAGSIKLRFSAAKVHL